MSAQNLSLEEIWRKTLAQIEVKLDSPAHYKTWFAPTELLSIQGKKAEIGVKNSYASDWLSKKHHGLIKQMVSHVAGTDLEPVFVISKGLVNEEAPKITKVEQQQASLLNVREGVNLDFNNLLRQANLNSTFEFSNYIVGPSNRLAHAASVAVSENPGTTYNPLFLYGTTGLGKTHLAQAIAHKVLEKSNGKKVLYIQSETFLNELVVSIKSGKTHEFRNKYRFLDLIIIDDIQMISKWEQTQDELFNTFNALHNKGKQIILASDRAPEKIHNLESRLKSRFQGGMVVQIEKPDFETRLAILDYKNRTLGLNLAPHVVEYIAKNISDNVRQLEGSMHQISLMSRIGDHEMTIEEVASLLGTDAQSKREKVKPQDIFKSVAREFRVTTKDILSKTRKADVAIARQVAMYILREDYDYKLEEIARLLNRQDHTTVMHAVDKIKSKVELHSGFKDQIDQVRAGI